MHYFQLFPYLLNSNMLCVEEIKCLVLVMFLFVGKGRLRQLPIQPCGWPRGSKNSKTGGSAPSSQYCYICDNAGLHHFVLTGPTKGRRKKKVAIKVFLHTFSCVKGRREQRQPQLQSRANQLKGLCL